MNQENKITLAQLKKIRSLYQSGKDESDLTPQDLSLLDTAIQYFGSQYDFSDYQGFLGRFSLTDITAEIDSQDQESDNIPKKDVLETTVPVELESLLGEYRKNQSLTESETLIQSSSKSVAEQVKIALAHRNIINQIKNRQQSQPSSSDVSTDPHTALVMLGSPKSESYTDALSSSFAATRQIASTYTDFSKLSPLVQDQLITSTVDLNLAGLKDLDTAIQISALQLNTKDLDQTTKTGLGNISSEYVSDVYQKTQQLLEIAQETEGKIILNQEKIKTLLEQGKTAEAKSLIETNKNLSSYLSDQQTIFKDSLSEAKTAFKDYETSRQTRLSKDPDLIDLIDRANKNISSIHDRLEKNGVTPHIYTPLDDALLLEKAIRKDMPGELRPNAGYAAEYAATLISHPKAQSQDLSPQAILLYGKNLTPDLLEKAQKFAEQNPNSALGALYKTRSDIFKTAETQLRKIAGSPIGKEITSIKGGLGNIFNRVSGYFSKISDKIPGGFGNIIRIVQDPWGALKSWAGRKAGEYLVRRLVQNIGNEALKKGAEMLLKNGLKESTKKLAQQAIAKVAAKIGLKVALQAGSQIANVVPGLGLLIAAAIEVAFWLGEKLFGAFKRLAISIYGEEIKVRDLLALPLLGASAVSSTVVSATSSIVSILAISTVLGFMLYVTSFAVAPLISTLVQLESTTSTSGGIANGCANTQGIFVSQRDPSWSGTFCQKCDTAGSCNIGGSGCGSASMTIILKSFGLDKNVIDVWHTQHSIGGYVYDSDTPPYKECGTDNNNSLGILTGNGLSVTDIGTDFIEADSVLANCGLILATGGLACNGGYCGHLLVIVGHNGNQITTMDPWMGENYIHTLESTYKPYRMWAVVP